MPYICEYGSKSLRSMMALGSCFPLQHAYDSSSVTYRVAGAAHVGVRPHFFYMGVCACSRADCQSVDNVKKKELYKYAPSRYRNPRPRAFAPTALTPCALPGMRTPPAAWIRHATMRDLHDRKLTVCIVRTEGAHTHTATHKSATRVERTRWPKLRHGDTCVEHASQRRL